MVDLERLAAVARQAQENGDDDPLLMDTVEELGRLRTKNAVMRRELRNLLIDINKSEWHWVEGESMKRILVARSAIKRISEAIE